MIYARSAVMLLPGLLILKAGILIPFGMKKGSATGS